MPVMAHNFLAHQVITRNKIIKLRSFKYLQISRRFKYLPKPLASDRGVSMNNQRDQSVSDQMLTVSDGERFIR